MRDLTYSYRRGSSGLHVAFLLGAALISASQAPAVERFRRPAPQEDAGELIAEPTLGRAAGHDRADQSLHVMEWVAKRTWHVLDLPYERKDFTGPPDLAGVTFDEDGARITATVALAGVPLRNQVISCSIRQEKAPILILLRSTDAFGEVLIELDLTSGQAQARSVTVSRSMIGGQSHSSPMPEESSNRIIKAGTLAPAGDGWHGLKIETRGSAIKLWLDGKLIFEFDDPDPAGGKFGFGSTGTVRVRDVEQSELITPAEKERRNRCDQEMYAFCKGLDAEFDGDVRRRNQVETQTDSVRWTWPATGATAALTAVEGGVRATVKAGLYGNDTLIDGPFPDLTIIEESGKVYRIDPAGKPAIEADAAGIRMRFALRDDAGAAATAMVSIRLTVQTVWFWTVKLQAPEGIRTKEIQAFLGLAPAFLSGPSDKPAATYMRHNNRAGIYLKTLAPGHALTEGRPDGRDALGIRTTDPVLRFATVILPAQPLNKIGFSKRMVHYIKYPEGPVQHWRRMPSFQEYPDNVDLARYKGHGTDAMVWHHTWISSDFRDREGFLVNEPEMQRAMAETHRLGMTTIGYIGVLPGRSSLLRIEDTSEFGGKPGSPTYQKNWDLQDSTFYNVAGRWQDFLPWMTDYWCREHGLDGFYVDGTLAYLSQGALQGPLHPEDADLSLDEMLHRLYYRVKKVFERHKAGFGLETWGGSHPMVNGFYDCQMIGESFQECPPERYRDQYNALLAGATYKMYGMRESSQNPYNIAMAAVNLSDIQVCSGNGAWGDVADTTDTWKRVRPLWDLLESIDWDTLIDARPWYAQELVSGEGFYAGNYTEPRRALIFLANRSETPGTFTIRIDTSRLPKVGGPWRARYVLGRSGDIGVLTDQPLKLDLPALHDGPIGIELRAR